METLFLKLESDNSPNEETENDTIRKGGSVQVLEMFSTKRQRNKNSPIWLHFTEKTRCDVRYASCNYCPSGRYNMDRTCPTGNMKYHLKTAHPERYKILSNAKKRTPISQPHDSERQLRQVSSKFRRDEADHALAILVGSGLLTENIIENGLFQNFCHLLQPKYEVADVETVRNCVNDVCTTVESRISEEINHATFLTICVDFWTQKNDSNYVGIVVQLFSNLRQKIQTFCLDLIPLHINNDEVRGKNVYDAIEAVLKRWKVEKSKIIKFLVDDGSEIFKDFRTILKMEKDDDESSFSEPCKDDSPSRSILNEVVGLYGSSQLPCVVHIIQSCIHVIVSSDTFNELITVVLNFVKLFIRSSIAVEKLSNACGKSLVHDLLKRNVVYYVIERLLDCKKDVSVIAKDLVLEPLTPVQWKELEMLKNILEPFVIFSEELVATDKVTISMVIPLIIALKEHVNQQRSFIGQVCFEEVINRFDRFLNVNHPDFDSFYAMATLLDPRFNSILLLNEYQRMKERCSNDLEALLFNYHPEINVIICDTKMFENEPKSFAAEMPSSSHFNFLQQLLEQQERVKSRQFNVSPVQEEITLLLKEPKLPQSSDPLDFWCCENGKKFSRLQRIAADILSVPASTAGVEKMFFQCGLSSPACGKKLRQKIIRSNVMIKANFDLVCTS